MVKKKEPIQETSDDTSKPEEEPDYFRAQDDDMGFVFIPQEEGAQRRDLNELDYQTLGKVAKRLGFTGMRKPKSSMITYIENLDADKQDIIRYLAIYDIDVQDIEDEDSDVHSLVFNMKPKTRLKMRSKKFCVSASSPKIANMLIEDEGYEYSNREGIPCDEWMASGIRVEHPSVCNLPNRRTKLRTYYADRLQERMDLLRSCKPEDEICVKRAIKGVTYFRNKLDEYPIFAPKKCYCGTFDCFQGDLSFDWYDTLLEQKRERTMKLAKLRRRRAELENSP